MDNLISHRDAERVVTAMMDAEVEGAAFLATYILQRKTIEAWTERQLVTAALERADHAANLFTGLRERVDRLERR